MLDFFTLLLLPVMAAVTARTAVHVYESFETPPTVIYVATLPIGLAQVLTTFGARSMLGGLVPVFQLCGACLAFAGAVALLHVARTLGRRGLLPRTTPLR